MRTRISCAYGKNVSALACTLRSFIVASISIARVICEMLPTDLMRPRSSLRFAMVRSPRWLGLALGRRRLLGLRCERPEELVPELAADLVALLLHDVGPLLVLAQRVEQVGV